MCLCRGVILKNNSEPINWENIQLVGSKNYPAFQPELPTVLIKHGVLGIGTDWPYDWGVGTGLRINN